MDAEAAVACRSSFFRVARYAAVLSADLRETLWNQPESLLRLGEPLRAKAVRRTVRFSWDEQGYVLKHYVEPSRPHALKRTVQAARARLTWNVMHKLADGGIATPRPVACIENRLGPLRRDSFLLYPYLEGRTLRSCFADEQQDSGQVAESLWRQLGELWQRLAQLRASLADTNVGNFIVCPAGRLWVIDLDKARFHRLAHSAARQQQRGWKQLLRSAAKC
ncbi:MAG: lipopolysaccharide kinase InaA family protein [Pirellulales bacterium]